MNNALRTVPYSLIMLATLALAGCGASSVSNATGPRAGGFDTAHAYDVEPMVQDKSQIVDWFGPPKATYKFEQKNVRGCTERWEWLHEAESRDGKRAGKALIVDFDREGKVCDRLFTQGV